LNKLAAPGPRRIEPGIDFLLLLRKVSTYLPGLGVKTGHNFLSNVPSQRTDSPLLPELPLAFSSRFPPASHSDRDTRKALDKFPSFE
jgi:hypothetical protein